MPPRGSAPMQNWHASACKAQNGRGPEPRIAWPGPRRLCWISPMPTGLMEGARCPAGMNRASRSWARWSATSSRPSLLLLCSCHLRPRRDHFDPVLRIRFHPELWDVEPFELHLFANPHRNGGVNQREHEVSEAEDVGCHKGGSHNLHHEL